MTDLNELGINVALLLAAGKSTRFKDHVPKQLYRIKDIPIIQYSINVLINYVDKLLIVTNTECYQSILEIVKTYNSNNFIIIINDKNCRLESIISCLNYINKNLTNVNKIIVHDSARPFIQNIHIETLLNNTNIYVQYILKLVNGLAIKNSNLGCNTLSLREQYVPVNRDEYIELCTPICCHYYVYNYIFLNYINKKNRFCHEPIKILNLLNINYEFIESSYNYLRKITITDDILYINELINSDDK